ncbi:GNAT family N-acetyltransferase [Pendulispora rubella]|uniref:GNAT family N-acetyltransferase n=1 Tax=Pendulispora rubella TaxID=2741070 RepID=A0ABZ2L1M1_9BACT
MSETMRAHLRELVRDWVEGWALSRDVSAPLEVPEGFFIHVGRPGHMVRYVLPEHDPAMLRALVQRATSPGTWLKICASRDEIELPDSWAISEPEFLMAVALHSAPPPEVPIPYEIEIETHAHITDARLRATDGSVAASGRIVVHGASAVVDQVVTDPAHRRRGLGSFVMKQLCARAADRGASRGALVATSEGLELYRSLGWTLESPMTVAILRPDTHAVPTFSF